MRYLLAAGCSPVAVLLCGSVSHAVFNGAMWIVALLLMREGVMWAGLIPVAHALLVVQRFEWDQRLEQMVLATQRARTLDD